MPAGKGRAMAEEKHICRRCLLQDMAGENDYYQSVLRYHRTLPAAKRTPDGAYAARLAACRACEQLENATCKACGCYVEMRAARLDMHCPLTRAAW